MAWIESHQELGAHPKTQKLARLLGISRPAAVGHLQFLWWWAMDYAQDGELSRFEAIDIAIGGEWDGDPDAFLDALIRAGFVDQDETSLRVHDWDDYAGRLLEKRRQDAERKRTARSVHRTSNGRDADIRETAHVTVPNRTEPNQTDEGERQRAPAREEEPAPVPTFEVFWAAYPRKTGKQDAEKAFAKLDPPPELMAELLAAIDRQQTWQPWVEGFVPHPATWLNGKRWRDEEPPRRSSANGRASPAAEPNPFDQVRAKFGITRPGNGPPDRVIETQGAVIRE